MCKSVINNNNNINTNMNINHFSNNFENIRAELREIKEF